MDNIALVLAGSVIETPNGAVELSVAETQVLTILARWRGRTVARSAILAEMYIPPKRTSLKSLDVFVCRIKAKLHRIHIASPIRSVRGIGLRCTTNLTLQGASVPSLNPTQRSVIRSLLLSHPEHELALRAIIAFDGAIAPHVPHAQ